MTITEKIRDKERSVRALLEQLRSHLNGKRVEHDKNPQSWEYITTLGIAETRLKELLGYLEQEL